MRRSLSKDNALRSKQLFANRLKLRPVEVKASDAQDDTRIGKRTWRTRFYREKVLAIAVTSLENMDEEDVDGCLVSLLEKRKI